MKNNLHARDTLICYAEIPIALNGEDSLPTSGHKINSYRYEKPMEGIRSNKKAKPKVEINDLLKKHFTNGICKVNPYLCFRNLAIFCNVHISELSKNDKVCTLGIFQKFSSP